MNTPNEPTLSDIARQLEAVTLRLDQIDARQRAAHELVEELAPIGREMIGVAGDRLGDLESRGYFRAMRQVAHMIDAVVVNYTEDDLQQLGDNLIGILDTVKHITQPEVLAIANSATEAVQGGDAAEPKGILGMLSSTRDPDVKKGLAIALEMLRHIGRAASKRQPVAGSGRQRALANHLAPRRARQAAAARPHAAARPGSRRAQSAGAAADAPSPSARPAASVPAPELQIAGYEMTAEGFLADPSTWTEAFAVSMANLMGVTLTDTHWSLIGFLREDYAATGVSPNIRRIGKSSPVSTKELYGMFHKAPAMQVARLAGLPKPAGCI